MNSLTKVLTSRAVVSLLTIVLTATGTALATNYPVFYGAICQGVF